MMIVTGFRGLSNYFHYSCSFLGLLTECSYRQEFPSGISRIFCNYTLQLDDLMASNLKCNDFERMVSLSDLTNYILCSAAYSTQTPYHHVYEMPWTSISSDRFMAWIIWSRPWGGGGGLKFSIQIDMVQCKFSNLNFVKEFRRFIG